jgi:hypothetical protein
MLVYLLARSFEKGQKRCKASQNSSGIHRVLVEMRACKQMRACKRIRVSRAARRTTEEKGGHHVSAEENKAIVHRYVDEVLNGENLDAVNELCTSDCVL